MPRWPLQRSVLALDAFSPLELTQHEFWPSTHHRSLQGDASASGHRVRRIASRPPVKQESEFAFSFSSNRDERQGNRAHYLIVRIESTTGRYGFVLRTTKTVWFLCLSGCERTGSAARKFCGCDCQHSEHQRDQIAGAENGSSRYGDCHGAYTGTSGGKSGYQCD